MKSFLKDWLVKGREEGFGIGAFNAANLEVIKGIVAAAEAQSSPVIIEASQGQVEYIGLKNFVDLVHNFAAKKGLPIFANLDHGKDIQLVQRAIELKFDMVHFDGSSLPIEENLNASAQLVELAHRNGVLLEVEFDKIQRSSEAYQETAAEVAIQGQMTDPKRTEEWMSQVRADLLAVSIGNLHGVYETEEEINLMLLEELNRRLDCFLTLHGGSGIVADQVAEAVKKGIGKINVNTELRLAYREALEGILASSDEVKVYKLMPPVIAAVQKVVEEKMKVFGSVGRTNPASSVPDEQVVLETDSPDIPKLGGGEEV